MLSRHDIKTLVHQSLPPDLMKALMSAVFVGYRVALVEVRKNLDKEERKTMLGHYRRAKINSGLRALDFRDGVTTQTRDIEPFWNYVEVSVGNVVVTAATVYRDRKLPAPARYRQNLAFQLNLFDSPKDSDEPIWVLLSHQPGLEMRDMSLDHQYPQAIYLTVLDATCTEKLYQLDLMEEFPEVVYKMIPDTVLHLTTLANKKRFRYAEK